MHLLKQSTAATVVVGPVLDSTGAAVTNAVVGDFKLAKEGTTATLSGATVTHDANGYYTIALTTTNTNTAGRLAIYSGNTSHSMGTARFTVLIASVYDALITNATNSAGGLATATGSITALAGAISTFNSASNTVTLAAATHTGAVIPTVTSVTNAVVLPSSATINITGNITGNVSGSVGSVTGNVGGNVVGSVGSISGVTFPSNFGSLSITVGGGVTVATNGDKTGYALTQSFPSNFASLAITSGGAVTAGTVSDKTGYSLSVGPLTSSQTAAAVWDALLSSYTVSGSFGARVTRLDSASSGNAVKVTGAGHIASDIHELQPAVINNTHFDVGAIDASAIASNAITAAKIASGAITSATFAADSITATALATSAGEEIADKVWDEAIAAHLASGSTGEALNNAGGSGNPWITDLATGYTGTQAGNILNQVKAKTDLITTGTIQSSIPVTAQGQIVGPLFIGDDYLNANGRAFQWTVALPSGFVAGTATCKFGMDHAEGAETGASFLVSGTVVDVGSGNVTLRFDVPRATTGDLVPGYYRWSVEITSAGGNEVTRVASAGNKLVEWREKQT